MWPNWLKRVATQYRLKSITTIVIIWSLFEAMCNITLYELQAQEVILGKIESHFYIVKNYVKSCDEIDIDKKKLAWSKLDCHQLKIVYHRVFLPWLFIQLSNV